MSSVRKIEIKGIENASSAKQLSKELDNDVIDRVKLLGFDFISLSSYDPLLNEILSNRFQKLPYLITPNLFQLVKYDENRDLFEEFSNSSFIMPDGQPIVIVSRLMGKSIKRRLTGSDFFCHFWEEAKRNKIKTYIVSPNENTAKQLYSENEELSYFVPPMFEVENKILLNQILDKMVSDVIQNNPSYVIIGLGFPKQECLAYNLRKKLEKENYICPLIMLLGASLEFYTGHKKRAPLWIQKIGLEWFHRFLSEPIRLFKRYFIESFKFLPMLYREVKSRRN